jgi:hypothetical protein
MSCGKTSSKIASLKYMKIADIQAWFKKRKDDWGPFVVVVGAVAFVTWFTVVPYAEKKAREVATSPETLAAISAKLRPYAIVNTEMDGKEGVFQHDEGAGDIIESVTLEPSGTNGYRAILNLRIKKFLGVAPLVRPMTPMLYVHSFWRTNKFDWAYELRPGFQTVEMDSAATGELTSLGTGTKYEFLIELFTK